MRDGVERWAEVRPGRRLKEGGKEAKVVMVMEVDVGRAGIRTQIY